MIIYKQSISKFIIFLIRSGLCITALGSSVLFAQKPDSTSIQDSVIVKKFDTDEFRTSDVRRLSPEANKYVRKGDRYFSRGAGGWEKALDNYKKALAINPNNSEVNFKLGYAYLQRSKSRMRAIVYLEKAYYQNNRVDENIHYYLAQGYHANFMLEEAIDEYRLYLEDYERHSRSLPEEVKNDHIKTIKKRIKECESGIVLREDPVRVFVDNIGDAVNSRFPEYDPFITPDGRTIYFTSRRPSTRGGKKADIDAYYYEDIYVSYYKMGKWTLAENLSKKFNKKRNDAVVGMSTDGKNMFIYRDKDLGALYLATLNKDSTWSKPRLIDVINTPFHESSATITIDGKTIYFVSDKPGGLGGRDIYITKLQENGEWGKPENLGETINTAYNEERVQLSHDGNVLYFASKGHNSMGGYDVFKSEIKEDGSWSTPINMGYPVNTVDDDFSFIPTEDGGFGYYASTREDGMGDRDIYIVYFKDYELKKLQSFNQLEVSINNKIDSIDANLERWEGLHSNDPELLAKRQELEKLKRELSSLIGYSDTLEAYIEKTEEMLDEQGHRPGQEQVDRSLRDIENGLEKIKRLSDLIDYQIDIEVYEEEVTREIAQERNELQMLQEELKHAENDEDLIYLLPQISAKEIDVTDKEISLTEKQLDKLKAQLETATEKEEIAGLDSMVTSKTELLKKLKQKEAGMFPSAISIGLEEKPIDELKKEINAKRETLNKIESKLQKTNSPRKAQKLEENKKTKQQQLEQLEFALERAKNIKELDSLTTDSLLQASLDTEDQVTKLRDKADELQMLETKLESSYNTDEIIRIRHIKDEKEKQLNVFAENFDLKDEMEYLKGKEVSLLSSEMNPAFLESVRKELDENIEKLKSELHGMQESSDDNKLMQKGSSELIERQLELAKAEEKVVRLKIKENEVSQEVNALKTKLDTIDDQSTKAEIEAELHNQGNQLENLRKKERLEAKEFLSAKIDQTEQDLVILRNELDNSFDPVQKSILNRKIDQYERQLSELRQASGSIDLKEDVAQVAGADHVSNKNEVDSLNDKTEISDTQKIIADREETNDQDVAQLQNEKNELQEQLNNAGTNQEKAEIEQRLEENGKKLESLMANKEHRKSDDSVEPGVNNHQNTETKETENNRDLKLKMLQQEQKQLQQELVEGSPEEETAEIRNKLSEVEKQLKALTDQSSSEEDFSEVIPQKEIRNDDDEEKEVLLEEEIAGIKEQIKLTNNDEEKRELELRVEQKQKELEDVRTNSDMAENQKGEMLAVDKLGSNQSDESKNAELEVRNQLTQLQADLNKASSKEEKAEIQARINEKQQEFSDLKYNNDNESVKIANNSEAIKETQYSKKLNLTSDTLPATIQKRRNELQEELKTASTREEKASIQQKLAKISELEEGLEQLNKELNAVAENSTPDLRNDEEYLKKKLENAKTEEERNEIRRKIQEQKMLSNKLKDIENELVALDQDNPTNSKQGNSMIANNSSIKSNNIDELRKQLESSTDPIKRAEIEKRLAIAEQEKTVVQIKNRLKDAPPPMALGLEMELKNAEKELAKLRGEDIHGGSVDEINIAVGDRYVINILFDFDKAVIRSESYRELDKLAQAINGRANSKVELSGHTDSKGPAYYNQSLSERRANAVKDYLLKKGVKSDWIIVKGYGESRPIAPNALPDGSDNPQGRQLNRRTEVKLLR